MGFFFNNERTLNKKQNLLQYAYEKGCICCPLYKARHIKHANMKPTGASKPLIYMLGEAPGETEDKLNRQFVGQSGELIRSICKEIVGSSASYDEIMRWNNVIRCWPGKGNRNPSELEIKCCKKELEADIESTKPFIVVGIGNIALQAILEVSGIMSFRGRFIPVKIGSHSFWFAPILHPSFIIRHGLDGNYFDKTYLHTFRKDLENIIEFAVEQFPHFKPVVIDSGYEDGIEIIEGNKASDVAKIIKRLDYFKKSNLITIDIETVGKPNGLSPYNINTRILSISVSDDNAIVAFPVEHKVFSKDNQKVILNKVRELLTTTKTKVAHNIKFEITWFNKYFGANTVMYGSWVDTMAQAVVLDERVGSHEDGGVLSLGMQTLINFGFNLKKLTENKINRMNLELSELKDVLMYNGMDAKYEHLLYHKLKKEIKKESRWLLNHLNNLGRTLALVESKGVVYDKEQAEEFRKMYDKKLEVINKKIRNDLYIREFEKQARTKFLPLSTAHITKLLKDIIKLPPVKGTAKTSLNDGGFSTDKEALDIYAKQGVEVVKHLVNYRQVSKQKSTYVDGVEKFVHRDGIIRASFNHLFVSTGRLSSRSPNMQNFPKRQHVEARNIIKAPEDHWIVAIDYAQLEARVVAIVAQDKEFMKMFWEGYDIHMDWAIRLAKRLGHKFDDAGLKKYRSLVKNQWVFPLIYGSSQASAEAGLGAKEGQLSKEYQEFWNMCNGVAKWQEQQLAFYRKHGYVITLLGRKRHMPLSKNEIYNTPIQSLASELVTDAMNRLAKLAVALNKPQYIPIWNIHDDLGFYIPDSSLEEDILFIAEQMVCVPFDFVNIPLGIEVSVGKRWGELEEVVKYDTLFFNPDFIKVKERLIA